MRLFLASLFLTIGLALGIVNDAQATNATNIFNSLGMTSSITSGGSMHSQARSIYSFGGGMVTAKGKKVTLMAVDPPNFSAGCSGISWHFGGFAFISADEIRQLIEAISQASLGIVVDLAMQTLCPQCYAVMNKLRDLANAARNATADACRVATAMGSMLMDKMGYSAETSKTKCGTASSRAGKSDSVLNSYLDSTCNTLDKVNGTLNGMGTALENWLNSGNKKPGADAVTADEVAQVGNMTYRALTALGYPDGLSKDILLSSIGMAIYPPKESRDCAEAIQNLSASSKVEQYSVPDSVKETNNNVSNDDKTITTTEKGSEVPSTQTTSAKAPSDGTKSRQLCYLPPLIDNGFKELGYKLVCGFDVPGDLKRFATRWQGISSDASVDAFIAAYENSSLGAMCNARSQLTGIMGPPAPIAATDTARNPWIYTCRAESGQCTKPKQIRLADAVATTSSASGMYTGLAWYIMDALYAGVSAVKDGKTKLPDATIAVLNGSDYPLYRVMNMSAVYGYTARQLLDAYAALIAADHVSDSLNQMLRPGSLPQIGAQSANGLGRTEVLGLLQQIDYMSKDMGAFRDKSKSRLQDKQQLVEFIMQVNRALQAEVISNGLANNSRMAVSLKKQTEAAAKQP